MARSSINPGFSKPRRSARLNNTGDALERLEPRRRPVSSNNSRKRRSSRMASSSNDRALRVRNHNASATPARIVKSEVLTCDELHEREKSLRMGERELKKRKLIFDEHEREFERSIRMREAQAILDHLEAHFQCSLCYEIIACPYVLSPAECGHTFCAICTIKWFFSRLHQSCGTWHESVACPLCRSLLIITPDMIPRPTITIPFAPNRLAENSLKAMVNRLAELCTESKVNKNRGITPRKSLSRGIGDGDNEMEINVKMEVDIEEYLPSQVGELGIESWAEGGALRKDWLHRDANGRMHMDELIGRWMHLTDDDFRKMKGRLGV